MVNKKDQEIENEEEYEDEENWEEIKVILGRLMGASKASKDSRTITLEVEEEPGSIHVFTVRYYISEKMSDEDFDYIRQLIGEQVEVILQDNEVIEVKRA